MHAVSWSDGVGQRTGCRQAAWLSPAPTHTCSETLGASCLSFPIIRVQIMTVLPLEGSSKECMS